MNMQKHFAHFFIASSSQQFDNVEYFPADPYMNQSKYCDAGENIGAIQFCNEKFFQTAYFYYPEKIQ